MLNERHLSSQAEHSIDLAITEQDRQKAIQDFFLNTKILLLKYSDTDLDKTSLHTPYVKLPSNVADIQLRVSGFFTDLNYRHHTLASIEGDVSFIDTKQNYDYVFILNQNGTAQDNMFVSLEEIQKAIKRVEVISKLLENKFEG